MRRAEWRERDAQLGRGDGEFPSVGERRLHEGARIVVGAMVVRRAQLEKADRVNRLDRSREQRVQASPRMHFNKCVPLTILSGGLLATGFFACGSDSSSTTSISSSSAATSTINSNERSVEIKMVAQNSSGEIGTARITKINSKQIRVLIDVKGEPGNAAQPAHIHEGTCANLTTNPEYYLTDSSDQSGGGRIWLRDGRGEVIVNATFDEVTNPMSPHAINIHMSPKDLPHYMSCGDIPAQR